MNNLHTIDKRPKECQCDKHMKGDNYHHGLVLNKYLREGKVIFLCYNCNFTEDVLLEGNVND